MSCWLLFVDRCREMNEPSENVIICVEGDNLSGRTKCLTDAWRTGMMELAAFY